MVLIGTHLRVPDTDTGLSVNDAVRPLGGVMNGHEGKKMRPCPCCQEA